MSSLSKRVSALEESSAAQVNPLPYSTPEEYRQYLDGIEAKLNVLRSRPREPWISRPVPANTEPTGIFLHNIMNRIAEQQLCAY